MIFQLRVRNPSNGLTLIPSGPQLGCSVVARSSAVTEISNTAALTLALPWFALDLATRLFYDKVEKAITAKTRVLILNTPHNPCGHCYTKKAR